MGGGQSDSDSPDDSDNSDLAEYEKDYLERLKKKE
jgi:hypothetical protein